MKLFLPMLSFAVLGTAVACDTATDSAQAKPVGLQDTVQGAQLATYSEGIDIAALFDMWEQMHVGVLLKNSLERERIFEDLKKNPPRDPNTGKLMDVTPSTALHHRVTLSLLDPTSDRMFLDLTPAISAFTFHANGPSNGLVGRISEEQARLRIAIADGGYEAKWIFYKWYEKGARATPRFYDEVEGQPLSSADRKKLDPLVKAAFQSGSMATGQIEGWTYETRPLTYFDKSCITCHTSNDVGDLAGLSLYMARKTGAQAQD